MSDEKTPEGEEIEVRVEIDVEEEVDQLKAGEKKSAGPDLVTEFQQLGRAFAEAFESAWNSEERKRVEQEVRTGVQSFADEVDKVVGEARSSPAGERVRAEATDLADKIEKSDIGRRTMEGISQGLAWMSVEIGRLAEQFTPSEKAPEDAADEASKEA